MNFMEEKNGEEKKTEKLQNDSLNLVSNLFFK